MSYCNLHLCFTLLTAYLNPLSHNKAEYSFSKCQTLAARRPKSSMTPTDPAPRCWTAMTRTSTCTTAMPSSPTTPMEAWSGLQRRSLLQCRLEHFIQVSYSVSNGAQPTRSHTSKGSQVNLYFVGGALSYIEADLGATANGVWLPVSNTLAITAVSPFVGYLQDLLGRREITLMGLVVIMVGLALVGTAHSFGQAIAGMSLSGAGAGICELTALAG